MTVQKRVSYQDVRDDVLSRIHNRTWAQGALLPTELELSKEFGCARATVNRALRELAEQGIIDRKRKSGTRVKAEPTKQAKFNISLVRHVVEEKNAEYRYSLVHRSLIDVPDWLRVQIGFSKGTQALHVQCMHYADNRPFQLEVRWINVQAMPAVVDVDFTESGPTEWLLREVPFSNAEITFSAVAADSKTAEFLSTPLGTPLFQMERTTWFQNQPITFVRMTYHQNYQVSTKY